MANGAIDGQIHVVELHGELDVTTAPVLRESLGSVYDSGKRRIIVDLGEVTFVDSSGLCVLVAAHNKLVAAGGGLVVTCSDPWIRRLFDEAGVARCLNVVQSRIEAIELARVYLTTG